MALSNRMPRRTFLHGTLVAGASALLGSRSTRCLGALPGPERDDAWQIGIFTRPWDQYDYRVALDAIATAGFQHAGLMTTKRTEGRGNLVISVNTTPEEAAQVGQEVKQRGLKVPSVYGGDFNVRKSLAEGIAGLRKLIDHCATVGSATLMLGGTGNADLYGDYYKAAAECCDYAAEKKVGLVLKPHGGLNATGPQCRKTIERVGHKSFTLWYDPGNIFYYSDGKLNPVDDCPTVARLVTGMCVKDFTMSQADGKLSKDVLLSPGSGMVDFPAVIAGLQRGGFRGGPLVIETLARGELPEILAAAKKAREFVAGLLPHCTS